MTRLMVAGLIATSLVLGGCGTDIDQNPTSTTSPSPTETIVEDQGGSQEDTGPTTDPDASTQESPTSSVLPEPGSGLDHPKSPNTTKVVPPPQD